MLAETLALMPKFPKQELVAGKLNFGHMVLKKTTYEKTEARQREWEEIYVQHFLSDDEKDPTFPRQVPILFNHIRHPAILKHFKTWTLEDFEEKIAILNVVESHNHELLKVWLDLGGDPYQKIKLWEGNHKSVMDVVGSVEALRVILDGVEQKKGAYDEEWVTALKKRAPKTFKSEVDRKQMWALADEWSMMRRTGEKEQRAWLEKQLLDGLSSARTSADLKAVLLPIKGMVKDFKWPNGAKVWHVVAIRNPYLLPALIQVCKLSEKELNEQDQHGASMKHYLWMSVKLGNASVNVAKSAAKQVELRDNLWALWTSIFPQGVPDTQPTVLARIEAATHLEAKRLGAWRYVVRGADMVQEGYMHQQYQDWMKNNGEVASAVKKCENQAIDELKDILLNWEECKNRILKSGCPFKQVVDALVIPPSLYPLVISNGTGEKIARDVWMKHAVAQLAGKVPESALQEWSLLFTARHGFNARYRKGGHPSMETSWLQRFTPELQKLTVHGAYDCLSLLCASVDTESTFLDPLRQEYQLKSTYGATDNKLTKRKTL
jgi:hypothetical protein